jgi:alpha-L-rhamnosidase
MFRRAPFIWTSRQPIDPLGYWNQFFGGVTRRDDGVNRWFLFRRVFSLPARADQASLTITVDGRYQLYVNGTRVGRGPARCDPHHLRADTYDIAPLLQPGENVLGVLVHVYGVDTSWYQPVRGHWQPVFGDGGLYCDGCVQCGALTIALRSDEHWRCCECPAWDRAAPRPMWSIGFVEVYDARQMPEGWMLPGFDASGWDTVQTLRSGGGPPDAPFGGMAIEPFPTVLAREIPFLAESPAAPQRVLGWYGVVPRPSDPVDKRLYQEDLVELPPGLVSNPDALLHADEDATTVRTGTLDVAVVLDFGRIHSGYPFIELDAHGGEVVEVGVAEGMPGEWSDAPPLQPRIVKGQPPAPQIFRYTARPGVQRFERFEWAAVRYAQVTVRDAPRGLRIRHVGSTFTHYPAEPRGAFACSDPLLTRLWEIGRYTLLLCMHDGWEDCPSREQRQWLGDATVEHLVGQVAFGPSINPLNRQFLHHAAESQRPDGLTQMFAPGDHHTDAIVIPDWTLQWILNAEQYWLYSGELDVIEAIFPAIQRALAWFDRQIGANDLVANLPFWHFMDWAALGRHGEAAALNAELVGTLRAAARLADALEFPRATRRYEALAARIAAALDARHWDARRGVYVDVVDPATGQQDPRVSQHANGAAILWDVAPRQRWTSIIERITDAQRLTFTAAPPIKPDGDRLDPESGVVLANTFYSHFVYRALCKAGRFDLALRLMRERYGPMLARGASTLWESFEPTASLCHGFSATPVYQLSTEALGVAPARPGFERFRVAPQPADLDWARGIVPTVRGDIEIAWERRDEQIALDVVVPAGCAATVVAPSGLRLRGRADLSPGPHRLSMAP